MNTNRPFLSNFLAAFRTHSSLIPKPGTNIAITNAVSSVWTSTTSPFSNTLSTQAIPSQSPPSIHTTTQSNPIIDQQLHPNTILTNRKSNNTAQHSTTNDINAEREQIPSLPSSQPNPVTYLNTHAQNNRTSSSMRSATAGCNTTTGPTSPTAISTAATNDSAISNPYSSSYQATSPTNIPISNGSFARRRGSDTSSDSGSCSSGGGYRDVVTHRGGERWYIGGKTARGDEKFYKLSMVRRDISAERLSIDRLSL